MPDGDITLSVTLSADDIKAKSGELRKNVQEMFNGVSASKLDKNLQKTYVQMDKLVAKSESITAKMREMETTKIKNPEIEKTEKELNNLYKTISNIGYVTQGGKIIPFSEEDREKAVALQKELDGLKETLSELMQNGSQVSLMEVNPEKYRGYASALNQCNNELAITVARAEQASKGVEKTGVSFSQVYHIVRTIVASIQTAFRTLTSSLRKFGSHIKSAFNTALRTAQKFASYIKGALVNAFKRVSGESNKAFSSNFLKKGLNLLLKYGLGVRSLYFAFRKLRTAIKEGMQNIVKFESAVGTSKELDSVNMAITNLNTSLLYLKNAWAAAISPVATYVLPVLATLADRFAQVGNIIARFVGALTGQEVVLNAVKVDAEDYADSLDDTKKNANGASGAVKKLTDRLASFDDLNVLGKDNDNEGSGGGGSGLDEYIPDPLEMFEYVDAINDFGKQIRDAWKNQDWNSVGKIIATKIDTAIIKPIAETLSWDNCKDTVMDFINQWSGVLNGFLQTTDLFDDIGTAMGRGITTVANTITQALGAVSLNTLGDDIYRVFKNAIESVDEMAMADAISAVFLAPLCIANGFFDGKDSEEVEQLFTDIGTKIANVANNINWYGIFTGIFNFASSIGDALIDTVVGFVNSGGFSGMLTQIADAINDAVNKLTPEDFESFGNAIGSLLVSVLSDLNTFMGNTSDSFNTIVEGVGDALANLPWEDIFENAGEIAVKIINAIIKVLNVVGQHMNDIQENGKTLAQNIGETIGECISQIDFEGMGETFGLIAEGIIDGIISAIENSDENGIAGIIAKIGYGLNKADADTFETIASLAIWGTVAKAIFAGITRALPVIFAQNSGQMFSAIGGGLSKAGGSVVSGAEAAGIGGWGTAQTASSTGSFVAGGIADMGALAVAVGGAVTAVVGLSDALHMMNGEMDETDFGGYNEEVDTFGKGWKNAFSSFDQFRLTFALGLQGIGDGFEWLGYNTVIGFDVLKEKWEEVKTNISDACDNIKENITGKFEEAKTFVEENVALFKENIALKWDEFKSNAEEKWQLIKETVTGKVEEFKTDSEEKIETLKTNLVNKWQEIKGAIYEKLVGIKLNMVEVFEQMKDAVKAPINGFLGIIETMVNRVIEGVNSVADTFNALPDVTLTNPFTGTDYTLGFSIPHLSSVSIPRLAEGAVIPPNREFMAVLGDQSHGTNIEAPLDTIKQAVAEVLANNGNAEMIQLLQQLITVVENKNLVIGDKDIGKANARYVKQQNIVRGSTF